MSNYWPCFFFFFPFFFFFSYIWLFRKKFCFASKNNKTNVNWICFFFTWSYRILTVFTRMCLNHRKDPNMFYPSGSEWTWEKWQWRGTPYFSVLEPHHQMQLSVIPKTPLVVWVLPLSRGYNHYSLNPQPSGVNYNGAKKKNSGVVSEKFWKIIFNCFVSECSGEVKTNENQLVFNLMSTDDVKKTLLS